MESVIARKTTVIDKMKSGSRIICGLCIIVVLFNLFCTATFFISQAKYAHDTMTTFAVMRNCISYGISAVIMVMAAIMFFRISKDGVPFNDKNVKTVRNIGILILINAILPTTTAAAISGAEMTVMGSLLNPTAFAEGLLFIFTSRIIRYGAMLQQESDETL